MTEWIEVVSKWLDYSLVNIRQLWFAWAITTTWVAVITAALVWHIRKPNDTGERCAVAHTLDPIVGNSGGGQ